MSRSRAATPAGKRRAATPTRKRAASRKRTTTRKPASRKPATRKPTSRKRSLGWRGKLVIAVLIVAAGAAGYFLWLRDSSLVAISDVEVVGITGPDRERITGELTAAAEQMTTLHVERDALEQAVAGFPTVKSISADANFPHGLRIEINERPPRMIARAGEREVAIAADGTLLEGVEVSEKLPVVELDSIPPEGRLGGAALEQALVVGAAPDPLRPLIEKVGVSDDHGVEVRLRGDLGLRFGTGIAADEKWAAAAALLADPELVTVSYIDVQVPARPVAGGQPAETDPATDPPA